MEPGNEATSTVASLQKHGLKVYLRDPDSYTPVLGSKKSLTLGKDGLENRRQIAQFSAKDAEVGGLALHRLVYQLVVSIVPLHSRPCMVSSYNIILCIM